MAELGEAGLLRLLRRTLKRPWVTPKTARNAWRQGVGDDAAIYENPRGAAGTYSVASCDMLVEDVDFRRRWATFADVGHKAAAVNLSDLAAMGAEPAGLLLGLALSPQERAEDVMALVRSLNTLGRRYNAPLLGGDLSRTRGPMVVSVTALGHVGRGPRAAGAPLLRRGGRAHDVIVVGGTLGAARAGLALLEGELPKRVQRRCSTRQLAHFVSRQLRPLPQLALGRLLGRFAGVHAVVDVSDGLLSDAAHLGGSGLGAQLNVEALPLAPGLRALAGPQADAWALGGGEDFVLAAAIAPQAVLRIQRAAAALGYKLTAVGRIGAGKGVCVSSQNGATLPPAFDHFERKVTRTSPGFTT